MLLLATTSGGFGQHIVVLEPPTITSFFKCLYAVQIVYPLTIAAIKYSILLFYYRIFHVPQLKWPLRVVAAVITAWWMAMASTYFARRDGYANICSSLLQPSSPVYRYTPSGMSSYNPNHSASIPCITTLVLLFPTLRQTS